MYTIAGMTAIFKIGQLSVLQVEDLILIDCCYTVNYAILVEIPRTLIWESSGLLPSSLPSICTINLKVTKLIQYETIKKGIDV